VELPADSNHDDFWEYASDLGILGTGIQGRELLFRPSPVLGAWITWIEEDRADHGRLQGNVLDVGCGSGRDMGFLVSREYEWYVTGVDNWAKAVERAEVMVKSINPERFRGILNAQVEEISGTMLSSLSCQKGFSLSDKDTIEEMYEKRFALVLVIRFFPREFFRHVHGLVDLGGYLIFSHFTDPPTGEKDYESPPREKRVGVGEVEELLKEGYDGWEILQGAYSRSEDGRTLWDVVARKT
jgi:SAM-dependent methyltransferase